MSFSTDNDLVGLLQRRLRFADHYRWVYDVQMTKFFTDHWCSKIPLEWGECLQGLDSVALNALPFGGCKATWPQSLKSYFSESAELAFPRQCSPEVVGRSVQVCRSVAMGMKPKKLHEVSRLAGVVHELCRTHGCQVVLDIGSGLGYLGHCLCEQCGLSVVGVERERRRVRGARSRHTHEEDRSRDTSCDKDSASCDSHVTPDWTEQLQELKKLDFSKPFLFSLALSNDQSEATLARLQELLDHLASGGPVCVVGLHCCGDLAPAILHLLPSLPPRSSSTVCCAVLLGCCYHKADRLAPPLSAAMRGVVCGDAVSAGFELGTFGLRLAAQETRERWCRQSTKEHADHVTRVAWRAVLEGVAGGTPLPRSVLRGVKCQSFAEYANSLACSLNDASLEARLLSYYEKCLPLVPLVEPFTALQTCMQAVLEGVVLLDWLAWLKERGASAHTLAVFDPVISPRNTAIVITQLQQPNTSS